MGVQFGLDDQTEKVYEFPCLVKTSRVSFQDQKRNGEKFQDTADLVVLEVELTTDSSLFLDAWLPSAEGEVYEVPAIVCHPINKPARLALKRPSRDSEKPHLLVMTVAVEDDLKKMMASVGERRVVIRTIPSSEEENYPV